MSINGFRGEADDSKVKNRPPAAGPQDPGSGTLDGMPTPERMKALDVFRGVTVAGMILVNSPGNPHAFEWIRHALWHGLTLADLVFPFFLFAVGASIAFSSRLDWPSVFKRTAILFALGIALNLLLAWPSANPVRIPGVLQRIALCYWAAAVLYKTTSFRAQVSLSAGLLFLYALFLQVIPVPGYGAGFPTPEGNWPAWLDRHLLGAHLYRPQYDPEGIASTATAIVTTLIGLWAGHFLQTEGKDRAWERLLPMGGGLALLGGLWALALPFNKALWSPSYVLLTGGLALALLAALVYAESRHRLDRGWTWAEALGRNAIGAYIAHLVGLKAQRLIVMTLPDGSAGNLRTWLTARLFEPWLSTAGASLGYALAYTLLWIAVFLWLYRRRQFIRI